MTGYTTENHKDLKVFTGRAHPQLAEAVAKELGIELVDRLQAPLLDGQEPDLTLVLDLPVEVGLARCRARRGDEGRFEEKGRGYHERVREGFLLLARREPARFVVIDASQDVEAVALAVWDVVAERLEVPR